MICGVCGEQASGFYNYGGPSCSSCRVFFRRMTCKSRIDPCIYNRDCIITVKTRTICQYCRYKKCLQNGMDPRKIRQRGKLMLFAVVKNIKNPIFLGLKRSLTPVNQRTNYNTTF